MINSIVSQIKNNVITSTKNLKAFNQLVKKKNVLLIFLII